MAHRARSIAALLATATALASSAANASVVFAGADGAAAIGTERIAFSTSGARTVAWHQLELSAHVGPLAWIVPMPRGGWIEPADPHWMQALDRASAPMVVPLDDATCPWSSARELDWDFALGLDALGIADVRWFASGADLDAALAADHFVVDASTHATLVGAPVATTDGQEGFALVRLLAGSASRTATVRVLGPAGRAFPLLPSSAARIVSYSFADGRASFAGLAETQPDWTALRWSAGVSNYVSLLASARAAAVPGFALTFTDRDGLFGDQSGGAVGVTIASLGRRYFGALSADEGAEPAPPPDAWSCNAALASVALSTHSVAPTCPVASAWPIDLAAPSCAPAAPDALAAATFACDGRDDLAAALGGLHPATVWLTRHEGDAIIRPSAPSLQIGIGATVASLHVAPRATGSACDGVDAGGSGGAGGGGSAGGGGAAGAGSDDAGTDNGAQAAADTAAVAAQGCSAGAEACSSSSGSSNEGCDSGSSGSSGSSGCDGGSGGGDCNCRLGGRGRPVRASQLGYLAALIMAVARRSRRPPKRASLGREPALISGREGRGAARAGAGTCGRCRRVAPPCSGCRSPRRAAG